MFVALEAQVPPVRGRHVAPVGSGVVLVGGGSRTADGRHVAPVGSGMALVKRQVMSCRGRHVDVFPPWLTQATFTAKRGEVFLKGT